MEEKKPLSHEVVCFPMLVYGTSKSNEVSEIKFVENYFFLENSVTSDRAVSYNVLYYQHLFITRYQVSFYANNFFLVVTNSVHCL